MFFAKSAEIFFQLGLPIPINLLRDHGQIKNHFFILYHSFTFFFIDFYFCRITEAAPQFARTSIKYGAFRSDYSNDIFSTRCWLEQYSQMETRFCAGV